MRRKIIGSPHPRFELDLLQQEVLVDVHRNSISPGQQSAVVRLAVFGIARWLLQELGVVLRGEGRHPDAAESHRSSCAEVRSPRPDYPVLTLLEAAKNPAACPRRSTTRPIHPHV